MESQRRFDARWRERLTLADGTQVELRLVRPDDAALLRQGFERLSPRSRLGRFHAPKSRLSQSELHYLTSVDGEQHLALGAVGRGPEGQEEGLGIARFIRLAEAAEVAEAAITVADAAQGKGLGRILLDRLVEAARERGVERFECQILPGNAAMVRLLEELNPDGLPVEEEEDALCFTIPLATTPRRKWNLLLLLLGLAAQGALTRRVLLRQPAHLRHLRVRGARSKYRWPWRLLQRPRFLLREARCLHLLGEAQLRLGRLSRLRGLSSFFTSSEPTA